MSSMAISSITFAFVFGGADRKDYERAVVVDAEMNETNKTTRRSERSSVREKRRRKKRTKK